MLNHGSLIRAECFSKLVPYLRPLPYSLFLLNLRQNSRMLTLINVEIQIQNLAVNCRSITDGKKVLSF